MPDFTVSLSDDQVATLLDLAEKRNVDPNKIVQQAIDTEKLIAANVGSNDKLLIRKGDNSGDLQVNFSSAT